MDQKWSEYLQSHSELFHNHSVVSLLRKTVEHNRMKPAVILGTDTLTFDELEKCSNQVARALVKRGVGEGKIISVSSGRSVQTIAAILGIWKTGAAYAYFDSDSPEEYNQCIRSLCDAEFDITAEFVKSALKEESTECFEEQGEMHRLAVVIFTSGSTGNPKGVKLTHRSLACSASNALVLGVNSDDHWGCFASFMFVAFVNDICSSLILGTTAYLIPKEIRRDIRKISDWYIKNEISITYLPPHMAMKYMDQPQAPSLKILMVGSEPARNLRKQNYRIINIYASSEGSSIITYYEVTDTRVEYPIGKIMPTYKYYVVKENGELAAAGENGELWLSGPQLFCGYLKQEELTSKKLISNPFSDEPGFEKVFKTDDIVSEAEEGLVYHGRSDNMVKVRGFRIELTSVEYHMLKFPGIKEACCTVFKDAGGTNVLFAYYISDKEIDHEKLRDFLNQEMPYYMVPSCIIRKDKFEMTPSGKVARKKFMPPPELNDRAKLLEMYR